MAKGKLECYHCQSIFTFFSAHAGSGDEIFFYCNQCGGAATVDMYSEQYKPFYEKYIPVRPYNAQDQNDLKAFGTNFKNMKIEISRNLASCPCGGEFTTDAMPRCPRCRKELEWDQMVDKIDKTSDSFTPGYFRKFVKKGWRDIYYFVFDDRLIRNNWNSG